MQAEQNHLQYIIRAVRGSRITMGTHKGWLLSGLVVIVVAVCYTEGGLDTDRNIDVNDLKIDQGTQDKTFADTLKELGAKSVQAAQIQNDFTEEERQQLLQDAINEVEEESFSMAKSMEKYATLQYSAAASGSNKRCSAESCKEGENRRLFEQIVARYENKLLSGASSLSQATRTTLKCIHHLGDFTSQTEIAKIKPCPNNDVTAAQCQSDAANKAGFRTIDGSCNNVANPNRGRASTAFRRLIPSFYEDGVSIPRGRQQAQKCLNSFTLGPFDPPTPSAREASRNIILDTPVVNTRSHSHLIMQWGQFLDHDLDLAPEEEHEEACKSCKIEEDCEPIQIRSGDTLKGTTQDGKCINFRRSIPVCSDSKEIQPREQVNDLTSFLDGSQIYGSRKELAERLRVSRRTGRCRGGLATSSGRLLPIRSGVENCGPLQKEECFLTGDVRANEQVGLTTLHTLFVREHNRIARQLAQINPGCDADRVYLTARKIVGAMLQKITFQDYLPLVLGTEGAKIVLRPYSGYEAKVDPSIPNVFATAALRYGHSLIQPDFTTFNTDSYEAGAKGSINLRDSFFNIQTFKNNLPDRILRGLLTQPALRSDEFMNKVLTTQLFFNDGVGLDLAALNIQRARDHGLPVYSAWRAYCKTIYPSLPDAVIGSPATLENIYKVYGTPEVADIFVAGMAERPLQDSILGPTFACIFGITFSDVRDGDRFYYENPGEFTADQLREIRKASLSRIICDNARTPGRAGTAINSIQPNAFIIPGNNNRRVNCNTLPAVDLTQWRVSDAQMEGEDIAEYDSEADDEADEEEEEEMTDAPLFSEEAEYMAMGDSTESTVN